MRLATLLLSSVVLVPIGTDAGPAAPRRERGTPFRAGETLAYDIAWSTFMTAGSATLTVREKRPSFDSVAYYIVAEGQPSPLLSALYTLYYKADTLLDVYTLLPQRGSLFSLEGRRRRLRATRFDQIRHTADYEVTTATVVRRSLPMPPDVQDPLSAIYAIRCLALGAGLSATMAVADGDTVYRVRIAVAGREPVAAPGGSLSAWKIVPSVLDGSGGDAVPRTFTLWVSDDSRRLPLRLEAEMPVGRFILTLRDAKG